MTNQQHPITPPPKLLDQWMTEWAPNKDAIGPKVEYVATQAARWGADQQLEACCEWVANWAPRWPDGTKTEDELYTAMRPKPISETDQALKEYEGVERILQERHIVPASCIRRALERLKQLETQS